MNTGLQTLRQVFLSIIPCHFAQICHHQNRNTEKWTLSLQLIQQVIFEQKELANMTVIDSGKLQ